YLAAARLPGSFLRDAAESLRAALAALRIEAHDGALGDERHDARRAQLGRLLHDEIQLLSLGEALGEPYVGRAALCFAAFPQPEHAARFDARLPARALPIEDLDLVARGESQDGLQVARLFRGEPHHLAD